MEIRSITFFCPPNYPVNKLLLQKAGIFMRHARIVFEQAGYKVQTIRLATPPFPSFLPEDNLIVAVQTLMLEAHGEGFDYVSIGPALTNYPTSYKHIPEIIASTKDLFVSALTTTPDGSVSLAAVHSCAEIVKQISSLEKNGFANLRFAVLANVPPFAPFFPAAYGEGWDSSFALALEAADLAIEAFFTARSLQNAQSNLIQAIEFHASKLEDVAKQLQTIYPYFFKGLDFTLAPFPEQSKSIGTAMETLGLDAIGMHGSLAAATFITNTLDQAKFKRCGFNGLMLPVLEDSVLAQRAAEGTFTISDLLLYSTVCGTGLDVIPLPGDVSADELYPILLDLSALSLRLNKPLTGRLMPLPGKHAGDPTDFIFSYFANSKVLPLSANPLRNLLAGSENLPISSRMLN